MFLSNVFCFNLKFFVSVLVGYVEHEQAVETSTDSKNHDGVWETGLDKTLLIDKFNLFKVLDGDANNWTL